MTEMEPKYKRRLRMLHSDYVFVRSRDKLLTDQEATSELVKEMQKEYPGNYTLVEKWNPDSLIFEFILKFDSIEEETLFLLKFS